MTQKVCKITIKDEVYSCISGLSEADFQFLFDKMSMLVEGAKWDPRCKAGIWNGRIPFLSKEGVLYTRLLDRVAPYLDKWGYELDFDDRRPPAQVVTDRIDKDWFKRKPNMPFEVELRPYQTGAINACLENQTGFILAATGAGKCLAGGTWLNILRNGTEYRSTYSRLFIDLEAEGCSFSQINVPVDISHLDVNFPTPTGWAQAVAAVKKEDTLYKVGIYDHGAQMYKRVECAAGHLFILMDGTPIAAKDMRNGTMIKCEAGRGEIVSLVNTGESDVFYDVSINTDAHVYYDASGVLHHNTWMVAGLSDVLANNNMRSLVIVPSDDLVQQTIETLRQAQLDVGVYSGANKDVRHDVVVATWQAMQHNPILISTADHGFGIDHVTKAGESLPPSMCNRSGFQCLIVDEAHGAKAKVVGELINKAGGQIPYRFGFTGTLPKPEIDVMTLEGSIGPVLFSITARELMDMGYLAEVLIQPVEIVSDVPEDFPDYASEKAFLSSSSDRMDFIADYVIANVESKGNTLVLVNSVKQGKLLASLIKDSVFLHGADDTATRKQWYALFDEREDLIVIATFGIASTGISIDQIHHLVMIDAGKSATKIIQSVGRSVRKGKGKNKAFVSDLYSQLKWSKKHWKVRASLYKEAQYPVNKVQKAVL